MATTASWQKHFLHIVFTIKSHFFRSFEDTHRHPHLTPLPTSNRKRQILKLVSFLSVRTPKRFAPLYLLQTYFKQQTTNTITRFLSICTHPETLPLVQHSHHKRRTARLPSPDNSTSFPTEHLPDPPFPPHAAALNAPTGSKAPVEGLAHAKALPHEIEKKWLRPVLFDYLCCKLTRYACCLLPRQRLMQEKAALNCGKEFDHDAFHLVACLGTVLRAWCR